MCLSQPGKVKWIYPKDYIKIKFFWWYHFHMYIEVHVFNTLHVFSTKSGFFVTKWQLQLSDFVLYELSIYEKIHHKTYFLLKCFLNNPLFHSVCYDFPLSCFTSDKMTTLSISIIGLPWNCCDKIPWLFHDH